ncbi:hypothetical protein ZWY2020_002509 [Hordeum vulgare]|nr:hypothetical protein ZWY2020_002509 [Hordeum vulgare]
MDPKVLLYYINILYEDPNTPLDDLKLPSGISHMVATFINEAKWKEQQAKQAKVAKLKKEKFLKQNLLNLTPDALVSTQAELKTLTGQYSKLSDRQSLKSSFIKFATKSIDDYNKTVAPPVSTPQPLIEESANESPQTEETPQAEEIPQDIPAQAYSSHISDWNSELILQFYTTLHISGDPEDINTWVFDWMTQNTHYKAPATELLHELPVSIPSEEAMKLYGERELPNGMMEVLMKPLAEGQSPRKTSLVHELKYTPRYVYRILCSVIAPIKGHDDEEDVVGIMKNILFNIIHGIPINIHDLFLRTLADNAMSPFDHKIYAPWLMRLIRTRTGINFHADFNNHVGYMPPIRVNKKTFEPVEAKGKSVIDEGRRPLM